MSHILFKPVEFDGLPEFGWLHAPKGRDSVAQGIALGTGGASTTSPEGA